MQLIGEQAMENAMLRDELARVNAVVQTLTKAVAVSSERAPAASEAVA